MQKYYFLKNFICFFIWLGIYTLLDNIIASSSNGRTADSDSVNRGSNPCEAANKKTPDWVFFYAENMR